MKRITGGSFLVIGTTIGAGMLSLPLITAACGLYLSVVLLIMSWSVMYFTSLKLINICEKHPIGINYTSLIKKKMPRTFQVLFTIFYLLLLYALMSAYTTQGASLIHIFDPNQNKAIIIDTAIFIIIFGAIVLSTSLSDYVNRSFVSIKLVFYLLYIVCMVFYINHNNVNSKLTSFDAIIFAWPTLLPSFGFQNIIPVLYEYQNGDTKAVKKSILIGSITVLIIYIVWIFACLGTLPQSQYAEIYKNGNTLNLLIQNISNSTQNSFIKTLLSVFINISVITSFICVGLSLYHYIKDTFKRFKITINKITGYLLTYTPPFIFTVFYPKGFILALQYAAIFTVVIFIYTPIYLDDNEKKLATTIYPILLGTLVIIAQIMNLIGYVHPFL